MTNAPIAFYIAGMDLNIDLIRGAVTCLKKAVSEEIKIYVGVEEYSDPIEGAILINTKPGHQWTGRARAHIEEIPEDKFVMLLEDYYFDTVDMDAIRKMSDLMDQYKAGVIKLHGVPKPDHGLAGQANMGFFVPGKKIGRVNTQPALWKKSYLKEMLFEDENLWEFEINSAVRSSASSCNVMGVYKHVIKYDEVVKRGKFRNRFAAKYEDIIKREEIDKNRGFLDKSFEIKFEIEHHFVQVMQKIVPQHYATLLRRLISS